MHVKKELYSFKPCLYKTGSSDHAASFNHVLSRGILGCALLTQGRKEIQHGTQ